MIRFSRLLRLLILILTVYCVYLVINFITAQVRYENFLKSLYITFDDFPSDYSDELKAAVSEDRPVEYDYSLFPDEDAYTRIPPIIHFIWFKDLYHDHLDITDMPHMGSNTPELCRKYNPDFTINVWNSTGARSFLEQNYPDFVPEYDNYRYPIQRIDYLKYFLLWHYGGVYMDLDISCRRSLVPLLQFPAWWPKASPFGVNNDLMASRPQHPMVGRMTQTLQPRNKNLLFPYLTIFWATGPQFTSDVLKMWFSNYTGEQYVKGTSKEESDPDMFYVLPQKFYSERYTFFGHRPGGTWHGKDVAVILWLVARPWVIVLVAAFLLLLWVFIAFRRRKVKKVAQV